MNAFISHYYSVEDHNENVARAVFFVRDGSEHGYNCMGWCDIDRANAQHEYKFWYGAARLAANIGIDDSDDMWAFRVWWQANHENLRTTYGRYKALLGQDVTFADFVRILFLEYLDPMSEDDRTNSWEYNDSSVQDWLVMGEDRSARVMVNCWHGLEFDESSMSYRMHYTPGDYPTFREFSNLEALNKEIEQWTR